MKVVDTIISGVKIIEPTVFGDDRGFFFESFNEEKFSSLTGVTLPFVQDNHSRSSKGVLRGLHYQEAPYSQGKLVRCVVGAVFDVAVDIRPQSPTFGSWFGVMLSDENKKQLWIPPGLAHGFCVLSDSADFVYKATSYYYPAAERSLRWDDSDLAIDWPLETSPIVSDKDASALTFSAFLMENKL